MFFNDAIRRDGEMVGGLKDSSVQRKRFVWMWKGCCHGLHSRMGTAWTNGLEPQVIIQDILLLTLSQHTGVDTWWNSYQPAPLKCQPCWCTSFHVDPGQSGTSAPSLPHLASSGFRGQKVNPNKYAMTFPGLVVEVWIPNCSHQVKSRGGTGTRCIGLYKHCINLPSREG